MKPLRSSLILLLLAVLSGIYLYFNERGTPVSEGAVVLLRAPREGVQRIRFSPANLELRRQNDTWRVQTARNSAPADPDAVKTLLDALELVQSDAPVDNAVNLKPYGLEKPAARLQVDDKVLDFGLSPRFDSSRVYARSGEQVALVPAILEEATRKSFEAWRDRAVLRFDAEKIAAFSLQTPQGSARFRKADESWKLEKPAARADAEVVNAFLSALASAKIEKWLDENGADAKKWGLEKPLARIGLDGARLEVGARQNGGYAARNSASNAVFLLPDATFALFNRPLRDWRDKTIARFDLNTATRLQIETQGKSKILFKNGSGWNIENGVANPKINAAALDLLSFAAALRARDFIDAPRNLAQYGLDKPILRLQIEADAPVKLRFGRAKNQLYAQQIGDTASQTIFRLSRDALDAIQETLAQLEPKTPK